MSWQLIGNEAGLMAIGLVFALLANVYMPDRNEAAEGKPNTDRKRISKYFETNGRISFIRK